LAIGIGNSDYNFKYIRKQYIKSKFTNEFNKEVKLDHNFKAKPTSLRVRIQNISKPEKKSHQNVDISAGNASIKTYVYKALALNKTNISENCTSCSNRKTHGKKIILKGVRKIVKRSY
jgi:hypothetical protein